MLAYNTLKGALDYELGNYAEDYSLENFGEIDLERTSRRIWKFLSKRGDFVSLRSRPHWQQEESLHHAVTDWLSMFEPTPKEKTLIRYGYECDTCADNHLAIFESESDALWFLETWESQGLKTWRID